MISSTSPAAWTVRRLSTGPSGVIIDAVPGHDLPMRSSPLK
jgi:hypothetical protein